VRAAPPRRQPALCSRARRAARGSRSRHGAGLSRLGPDLFGRGRRGQRLGQRRDREQHWRAAQGVRLPRVMHQNRCVQRCAAAGATIFELTCPRTGRAAPTAPQTRISTWMQAPCRPSSTARCSCLTTAARRVRSAPLAAAGAAHSPRAAVRVCPRSRGTWRRGFGHLTLAPHPCTCRRARRDEGRADASRGRLFRTPGRP